MRPVTLNLASRPFRNNTLVGSALGIGGAALVLGTAYNLYVFLSYGSGYAQLQRDQAEDRVKIESLQVEERRLVEEIRQRDFRKLFEQGRIAGELIVRGAFSWTQLFNTLETVVPPDVVMTAIRPNITTEGIVMRIEGVAKNHGALLAFETRLQESPAFVKVYPASERRLNPSLPDITFLLTCDYLPRRQAAADLVAAASPAEEAAARDAVGAPGDAARAETAPVAAAAAPGGRPAPPAAGDIVGREGEPRVRRAAGPPVLAPGAIYAPAPMLTPPVKPAKGTQTAPFTATREVKAALAPPTPRAAGPSETAKMAAVPVPGPASAGDASGPPGAPVKTASAAPARGRVAGRANAAADPAGRPESAPVRTPSGPRGYDPNVPHTMPPERQAAIEVRSKVEEKPAAAIRLDVPLTFVSRPVEEVYQRLSEAHGVRFDLEGGVNRSALVTLNLRGRKLEDAILLVSGTARHKVKRVAEGVYQVSPDQGGRTIPERSISEEPIREDGP